MLCHTSRALLPTAERTPTPMPKAAKSLVMLPVNLPIPMKLLPASPARVLSSRIRALTALSWAAALRKCSVSACAQDTWSKSCLRMTLSCLREYCSSLSPWRYSPSARMSSLRLPVSCCKRAFLSLYSWVSCLLAWARASNSRVSLRISWSAWFNSLDKAVKPARLCSVSRTNLTVRMVS